jgi:hypothetical protein
MIMTRAVWVMCGCVAVLIAGCASDVKLEGTTTSSVTVSFDPRNSDGLKEATQIADRQCREQNRSAVFQNVMPYGSRNLASFTCGPR